jgi:hypothetical protein
MTAARLEILWVRMLGALERRAGRVASFPIARSITSCCVRVAWCTHLEVDASRIAAEPPEPPAHRPPFPTPRCLRSERPSIRRGASMLIVSQSLSRCPLSQRGRSEFRSEHRSHETDLRSSIAAFPSASSSVPVAPLGPDRAMQARSRR